MEELKEEMNAIKYLMLAIIIFSFLLPFKRYAHFISYRDEEGTGMDKLKNWRKVSGLHLDSSGSPKKANSERRPVITLKWRTAAYSANHCVNT